MMHFICLMIVSKWLSGLQVFPKVMPDLEHSGQRYELSLSYQHPVKTVSDILAFWGNGTSLSRRSMYEGPIRSTEDPLYNSSTDLCTLTHEAHYILLLLLLFGPSTRNMRTNPLHASIGLPGPLSRPCKQLSIPCKVSREKQECNQCGCRRSEERS
jgi:hypothetical protein